jgi:predicted ATPase/DNA-binding SARP family transcriptional activator
LYIQLLGDFQLSHSEQPATGLDAPRLQSLLAYLLLHRNAPQPRRHLAFRLWPDSTEAQARTNLRKALHVLRRTLPGADRFLDAGPHTLQWRPDAPFRLDVLEFERAASEARTAAALQDALSLYRGDLLPGCYDDWIAPERERLQNLFVETTERLLGLLEEEHDTRTAIHYTQRLLRHDPLREETYQRLMRLYARSGDRAGAMRIFQACATVLKQELGVEVSSATREVFEQVMKTEARPALPSASPSLFRTNNLPIPLTTFVGREREIAELLRLLTSFPARTPSVSSPNAVAQDRGEGPGWGTRLITLTGPGGCGKTRLALQLAGEVVGTMTDGAWLVELASLSDPALVPQAVASALGVHEQPGRALPDTLADHLQATELLLILDNCEHLTVACARLVETLLRACARVRVLATSRERLNLPGETIWLVPSLSLPDAQHAAPDSLIESEAIRLFVERAATVLPTFTLNAGNAAAIAQICRHLDGIPLAIELAAARVRLLPPAEIAARLDDVFRLLAGGSPAVPPRHQTLRATMDWSYRLLSEHEQVLFRRLSVFAGGWSLAAAEYICTDAGLENTAVLELLSQLIDKSLVIAETAGGDARYRMLETVRQYGHEKLHEARESVRVHERHARFFIRLAEEAQPEMKGSEQIRWLDRLEIEHDNLRVALRWALNSEEAEPGLRLVAALDSFWRLRDHVSEGRAWAEQALARAETLKGTPSYAQGLISLMYFARSQGDYQTARSLAEDCLALCRELGDTRGVADTLMCWGLMTWHQSDFAAAQSYFEQSLALFREADDPNGIADSLHQLGHVTLDQGRVDKASIYFADSLTVFRAIHNKADIATLVGDLGLVAYLQEDFASARAHFEESLALFREVATQSGIARSLNRLGDLARCESDYGRAGALYRESLALYRQIGEKSAIASALHNLGYVEQSQGDDARAEGLFQEGLRLFQEMDDKKGMAECLMGLAGVLGTQGHGRWAARLFGAAEMLHETVGATLWPANRIEYERNMAALRIQLDETALAAERAAGRSMTLDQAIAYALERGRP